MYDILRVLPTFYYIYRAFASILIAIEAQATPKFGRKLHGDNIYCQSIFQVMNSMDLTI